MTRREIVGYFVAAVFMVLAIACAVGAWQHRPANVTPAVETVNW